MFGPEVLGEGISVTGRGDWRRVSTDVNASGDPKESGHEGHVKGPRDTMAIR